MSNTLDPGKGGHRQRLREKFLNTGHSGFADYELLELFLTYAIPRKDVKPIAKQLMAEFKTLGGVFDASIQELSAVAGIGENAAVMLKLVRALCVRYLQSNIQCLPYMDHVTKFYDYARMRLGDLSDEVMMVFFLNAKNYLIKEEILGLGTTDQVNVFPNKIAKHALMNDAKAVVLCHNHPSGVVTPSIDDTQTTYTVKRILKPLDIILLDHIIVPKFAYYSYREEDAHKPAAYKVLDAIPGPQNPGRKA